MNGFIHIFTDIAGDAIEAAHGQGAAMDKVTAIGLCLERLRQR
ncbi:hypothetical protein BN871_BR_00070 [Paenibacillus sp. P22]|nr:hypothetical protein BN871_BR_00070 [Paenibacillus sp. P22]